MRSPHYKFFSNTADKQAACSPTHRKPRQTQAKSAALYKLKSMSLPRQQIKSLLYKRKNSRSVARVVAHISMRSMPVGRRRFSAVGSPPFFAMVHNPIEEGLVVTYIVPGLFGFEPFVLHYLLSFGKKFLIYIGSFERDVAYGIWFCLCASHKKC